MIWAALTGAFLAVVAIWTFFELKGVRDPRPGDTYSEGLIALLGWLIPHILFW